MEHLFVYGTLRKGQSNHRVMRGSKLLFEAALSSAEMYDTGGFPVLIYDPENKTPSKFVIGEVYEVDEETLKRLDWFEGVPHLYQRIKTYVNPLIEEDEEWECWVYVYQRSIEDFDLITSGDWTKRLLTDF